MELFTKIEVCRRTSLSLSTINRAIAAGHLQRVKIGSAVRIPESALEDFIASLKETDRD